MVVYILWSYNNYYPSGPGDIQGVYLSESDAEVAKSILENEPFRDDHIKITVEAVK